MMIPAASIDLPRGLALTVAVLAASTFVGTALNIRLPAVWARPTAATAATAPAPASEPAFDYWTAWAEAVAQ